MKRTLTVLLACLLAQAPALARQQPQPQQTPAQTPPPAPTPDVPDWLKNLPTGPAPSQGSIQILPPGVPQTVEHDEDDVVRITSNLVQIDAVVTDKKGRLVTDLKPDEFEILADGRPQKITNFSYVQNIPDTEPTPAPAAEAKSDVAAPPPARLRPEQVRRTVAFVFNDLEMSAESVYYARKAIQKFVDEQMQPGDFVAILPASGGSGALQQFTNDKRLLDAAIKNLRWQPQYGRGVRPFEAPDYSAPPEFEESEQERSYFSRRRERFSVATLGALDAVVGALRDLPGRKSLVLLSDGIPMPPPEEDSGRVLAGINRVIESANRASVIVYTVDVRGLPTFNLLDASSAGAPDVGQISKLMLARGRELNDSQIGLRRLAEETGGVAYVNSNDIGGGVRRALEDQKGYYLIGYRPDEGTFDPATGRMRYHKLTLNVTRPDLKVRTRQGFFGFTGKSVTPATVPVTRAQQLRAALVSPFPAGGVSLRLTSLFGQDPKQGAYVRSFIHIDGRDLTFRRQPDGSYKSVIDVVVLTFGTKGLVVGEANTTHTVTVSERVYKQIQEAGLFYDTVVQTKKAGGYQLRVAVRDVASERTGSASQYVEVPDVKKGRLALSGIVIRSEASMTAPEKPSAAASKPKPEAPPEPETAAAAENLPPPSSVSKPEEAPAEGPAPPPSDPQGSPAVRRFRRGSVVDYGFYVYNAKSDPAAHLQTQLRLFRDGKLVYEGKVQSFEAHPLNVQGDVAAAGRLQLGKVLGPGDYAFQIVVTDPLAKEKQRVAAQWIDFEVVD
ncbi:MAG: VWA domain-containing protein [Acidobacteria bacterium]|nr:VWA domain-containing protein [Acidobacteriota bacterium]